MTFWNDANKRLSKYVKAIYKTPIFYLTIFLISTFFLFTHQSTFTLLEHKDSKNEKMTNTNSEITNQIRSKIITSEIQRKEKTTQLLNTKLNLIENIIINQTRPQLTELVESYNELSSLSSQLLNKNLTEIDLLQQGFTNVFSKVNKKNTAIKSSNDEIRSIIGNLNYYENGNLRFIDNYTSSITNSFMQMLIQVGVNRKDKNGDPIILIHNALILAENYSDRVEIYDSVHRWHTTTIEKQNEIDSIVNKIRAMKNGKLKESYK